MKFDVRILMNLFVFTWGLTACTMDVSLLSLGSDSVAQESISVDGALTVSGLKITSDASPNLTLTVTTTPPAEMKITSNATCAGGSWVPFSTTVNAFPLTASDGVKDISAQFKDTAGVTSSCVKTTVLLDTSAPTGAALSIGADYLDSGSVAFVRGATTLGLGATDATLYQMNISNDATCASGSYEAFANTKAWTLPAGDGVKNISVKYQDLFSHESSCVASSVVLDSTASAVPVVAVAAGIDGVGTRTVSPKLFVRNQAANEAADATHSGFRDYQARVVRVSDSAEVVAWTTVGTGTSLQLTGLTLADNTSYRMEVRSRDKVGNTSAVVSTTWTSSLVPFYVKSIENATPSTEYTSDSFTLSGTAGAITVAATGGTKVCISPCADWNAAGASVAANAGDTILMRAFSPASGTLVSNVTAGSYATTWKISTGVLCPTNYVLIPGENGTAQGEFCLAKYEMKIAGDPDGYQTYSAAFVAESRPDGTSWRDLNLTQMISECQALGAGYDLISNPQWNTVARNIANVATNWSTGVVNGGQMNQGNRSGGNQEAASPDDSYACFDTGGYTYPADLGSCSDTVWNNLRRTHVLSNGAVIWDFSGGAWEGVKTSYSDTSSANSFIVALTDGTFFKNLFGAEGFTCPSPGTTENCGLGYAWTSGASSSSAIFRGGSASNGAQTGIFTIDFDYDLAHHDGGHGFRCVAPLTN
ncbi:hypothetical protein [Bdellovibrio sp. HCB209]|uniref:hypothetical protein n=1 Tax=Bdellovibrio sp. HCB209 TaxID=3394354 RepID=UPI0039B4DCF3